MVLNFYEPLNFSDMKPDGLFLISGLLDVVSSAVPSKFEKTLKCPSAVNKMLCLGNYPHFFVIKNTFSANLLCIKVFRLTLF